VLQNAIGGLQGIIDHAMVGHFVGYTANAAIGVSWQIVIVVIVFITSLFTGMAVLVARFAGANDPEKVNRVVYQAFLTAVALSVVLAVVGYAAAPWLLDVVNAAPEVRAEALPFLRAMFVGIFGMMMFFMLSGAFRAAGDPQTPLRLGVTMTVLTVVFNVMLIPALGTLGAALGTIAVLVHQEIVLLIMGGVFVMETVSVILQVGSFKLTGRRIFAMAPLHHHFEMLGWKESKIIIRFWIAGLVLAMFALTTLKLR